MTLSGQIQLSPFDILQTYNPATTQDVPANVGQIGVTPDGRIFRLALAGAVNLSAGKLTQSPAVVANAQAAVVSAQSIGDTQITVTLGGSSTIAANFYAGGLIAIVSGTGSVQTLSIKGHAAVTAGTSLVLNLADPILIATASSPTANLWPNPWSNVLVYPTTTTGSATGIPIVPITAAYYGWIQTGGIAICLNQGGTTVGLGLAPSGSVAGALATVAATTNQVAVACQTGADTAYSYVELNLD